MSVLTAGVAVRVAVQSPQRLLRDTLAACLAIRPDVTLVGRVAEADDVPDLCRLSGPDVVILDAGRRLGEMAGLVGNLVRRFPELNVIVIYREATEEDLAAENVQARLFRKLGVRNRSGALAVADAFGLLPPGALRPV